MFRWEIATAVAGSILGINAFNQPDVEASKIATKKLTSEYEKTGSLPAETPILTEGGVAALHRSQRMPRRLLRQPANDKSWPGYLRAHLNRLGAGDYFALLAYVEMNDAHERGVAGDSHEGSGHTACGHVSRIRAALPAFDRAGV